MEVEFSLAPYPGRGIIHHVAADGSTGWIYFITGRSSSSRDRRIRPEGESLTVIPADPELEADPLRHYRCVRRSGDRLVIGNGDHVDVLVDGLANGLPLDQVVKAVDPEPDPPIFTPRIALVLDGEPTFVAVKRSGSEVERVVIDAGFQPATATVICTYNGTAKDPLGSAPIRRFSEERSLLGLASALWSALDPAYRVALIGGHVTSPEAIVSLPENTE